MVQVYRVPANFHRRISFPVHPPVLLTAAESDKTSEAPMIRFETAMGEIFMNAALRHNKSQMAEQGRRRIPSAG
jgi:hypothetical protein